MNKYNSPTSAPHLTIKLKMKIYAEPVRIDGRIVVKRMKEISGNRR